MRKVDSKAYHDRGATEKKNYWLHTRMIVFIIIIIFFFIIYEKISGKSLSLSLSLSLFLVTRCETHTIRYTRHSALPLVHSCLLHIHSLFTLSPLKFILFFFSFRRIIRTISNDSWYAPLSLFFDSYFYYSCFFFFSFLFVVLDVALVRPMCSPAASLRGVGNAI
eukprot:gene9487-6657_t